MLYSFFLKNIVLPAGDFFMKTSVFQNIRLIQKLNKLDNKEIIEWQNKKIQFLVKYAYENTSYYKELFDKNSININSIKNKNDLLKIPILTKKDIRDNFDKLIVKNSKISYDIKTTGGSTGEPLKYFLDKGSWSFSNANNIINWEKAGYKYGEKFVSLGSTSLFVINKSSLKHWIYYQLKQKIGLNGINMSDKVCAEYLQLINKNRICYIYGYASSIFLLAKYVIKENIKTNIKVCFTTSEVLSIAYRNTIIKAFNCKIVDCYGAHDGGITAFAHEEGFFEVGYSCVVNEIGNNALLTNLINYSMPFINYQVGDEVVILDNSCKSNTYNGQMLKAVNGRASEILSFSNNKQITGPGFTILFKDIPVEYYCLEKTSNNSITCWYIAVEKLNTNIIDLIYKTLQKQFGHEIQIEIKETDKPFLANSGKQKFIIDSTNKI